MICVIPARGNSKGVPRKNLRLLNGHPLLWYSIQNAKQICDTVIVTSEDEEILEYAKYLGVIAHKRPDELSQDSTTIDPVICEAVEGLETDYVVTLQPTSPTLKYFSVIEALKKLKDEELDWIVSVTDDTHIHHTIKGDEPRVNRQFMPKNYKETGGFQICKKENLYMGERFYGNGSFWELSQEEGLNVFEGHDIDTETDFLLADAILNKLKIQIIYTSGSSVGYGHKKRAELLKTLFTGHEVILSDVDENRAIDLDTNIVILDVLNIDSFNLTDKFIVTFENLGEYRGDLCINGIYNEPATHMNRLSGYQYMTINDHLILKDCYNPQGKVIVCFGGTDPMNYTNLFRDKGYEIYEPNGNRKINWNDTKLVITGAGNIVYEATTRKLPVFCMPQNDREKTHECLKFGNVLRYNTTSIEGINTGILHEAAFQYDFSNNNERVKDLIINKYREWKR